MPNRVYNDLNKLRFDVNYLIDRGRVRVHRHAGTSHPEFSELEQIAAVRFGGPIRADLKRNRTEGVYVCWANLPLHGLCRAVFCIEDHPDDGLVLVITVFRE
jgi:hypothetical protein